MTEIFLKSTDQTQVTKEPRRSESGNKTTGDKQVGSYRVSTLGLQQRKAVHLNFYAKELPGKSIKILVA